MASNFKETNSALSRLLVEEARAIGVFDHPTAKGDGREDLVRKFVADRIGTTFGVSKAEVVDSRGSTSGEIDAVVFDQSTASCLSVLGERRILRAESVALTIEVKSELSAATWLQERQRVEKGIGSLMRFYEAAPLLLALQHGLPEDTWKAASAVFEQGLSTLDDHEDIPAVVSTYFGFTGPSEETIKAFIETPLLDAVCVLGKYTLAKKRVGFKKRANGGDDGRAYVWGRGDDALGAFLQIIEMSLANVLVAKSLVRPSLRYYEPPSERQDVEKRRS